MKTFNLRHRQLGALLVLTLLLFARTFAKFPSLSWRAEFWAESGTNFFCRALAPFSLKVLATLDSGYISLLARTLSLLTVTILGFRDYAPHAQQIVGLIVIAICAASLLKVDWGESKDDVVFKTFVAGILLMHWDYGMYAYLNISYYAVVPLMVLLGLSIEHLRRHWWLLTLLMPLLILNKPFILSFFPVYAIFAAYLLVKRKEVKASLPFIVALVLMVIQLCVAISHRTIYPGGRATSFSVEVIISQLKATSFFLLYSYETLLTAFYTKAWSAEARTTMSIMLILAQCLFFACAVYKKRWRSVWFAGAASITACICELMTAAVFYRSWTDYDHVPNFADGSHFFFAFALFFLALAALTAACVPQLAGRLALVLFIAASSNVFGFWQGTDPVPNLYPGPTLWEQQRALFHQEVPFIDVHPDGWRFQPAACMAGES